jgi:hypothetical protein
MRIGIVDLDTSHPENWIPVERDLGCDVVGVFDGGSIHPPQYVNDFAKRMGIPRVYERLEEMARVVDCAVIHGCDWDTHVAKARPFVELGKSVLLDKPLAGNLRDLQQIQRWVKEGARITGGSSLRFCYETAKFLAQPVDQRGVPHTMICGCAVDDFNYGIHAYSFLCGVMGPGIRSVRHLGGGNGAQRRIQINWTDGRMGVLVIGKAAVWLPFYATIVTERAATQIEVDAGGLYRALLENCLPYLERKVEHPPATLDVLVEAELAALAAQKSWSTGDVEVSLASLGEEDPGYDGAEFAAEYRAMKYPTHKG